MNRFESIIQGGLYRSRKGVIFGVCRGIADSFKFSVFWTRAIAVILLFVTGFWPVAGLYFIAALLMKPEPAIPISDDGEQEFYESYLGSRSRAADRIRRRYESLERRIRRMESRVTSPEYDFERRLNSSPQ